MSLIKRTTLALENTGVSIGASVTWGESLWPQGGSARLRQRLAFHVETAAAGLESCVHLT